MLRRKKLGLKLGKSNNYGQVVGLGGSNRAIDIDLGNYDYSYSKSDYGHGSDIYHDVGYGHESDSYGHTKGHDIGYSYVSDGYGHDSSGYGHDTSGYGHSSGGYGHSSGGYGHVGGGYGHEISHGSGGYGHSSGGYGHSYGGGYGHASYGGYGKMDCPGVPIALLLTTLLGIAIMGFILFTKIQGAGRKKRDTEFTWNSSPADWIEAFDGIIPLINFGTWNTF